MRGRAVPESASPAQEVAEFPTPLARRTWFPLTPASLDLLPILPGKLIAVVCVKLLLGVDGLFSAGRLGADFHVPTTALTEPA